MPKAQSIENKLGEVNFRKKLVLQFLGKEYIYKGQPGRKEYLKIIQERVDSSRKIFKDLSKKNIPLSPFLEIGAERGQRSLLLVNEFEASGFATDLSYESLLSAKSLLPILRYQKLPILVCCDAYNLPFKDNSFAFIFCFQTLHHFPDPAPIVKEIYRVLSPGGYFYFSEEPIRQKINLNFWKRDYHLKWWENILKYIGILPFISTIGSSEVGEGILEESFDLVTWKKALDIFSEVEVTLKPYPFGPSAKRLNPPLYLDFLLKLLGGGITALCKKRGMQRTHNKSILDSLKTKKILTKNGVLFLLPKNLMKILYPKIK